MKQKLIFLDIDGTLLPPGEMTVPASAVEAIRQACRAVGGWNLHDCALYVTLEPCPMCAGAIINARVGTVCYGARDEKAGACGSVLDLFAERFNHRPRVYGGVLKEACAALLQDFFHDLRKNSPDFSQN